MPTDAKNRLDGGDTRSNWGEIGTNDLKHIAYALDVLNIGDDKELLREIDVELGKRRRNNA